MGQRRPQKKPVGRRVLKQKRTAGHDHASALRCLGKRWLKILWRLWTDHTTYDEDRHQQNQQQHGSWVPALVAAAAKTAPATP